MNLASMITEDATVIAIVRDRAERLWRRNGQLTSGDIDYATRSTYISGDEDRKELARQYFDRMVNVSRHMSYIMSRGSNEQVYKHFFGVYPKHEVKIESRPYGIHFILHDDDIKATGTKMKEEEIGIAYLLDGKGLKINSKRISHSIGRSYKSIDEFAKESVEKIVGDKELNEKFRRKFNIGLDKLIDTYREVKSDSWKHWLKPKWERVAKEIRCEMLWERLGKYIMGNYLKERENREALITEHELEHLHSHMMLSLSDLAVHEVASYSTPKGVGIERADMEFESKVFKVYSNINEQDLRDALSAIKEARKRKLRGLQKKILPIAFSRSGTISRLSLNYHDILDTLEGKKKPL
ncbi:MAG: hypothetical protein V1906_00400 [Candidatus Woesearchaeota archaeon]